MAGDKAEVRVLAEDAEARFSGMHKFAEGSICVATLSALLKFLIPELLPELNRVLYLDGDLIVKELLDELFADPLCTGVFMRALWKIAVQCTMMLDMLKSAALF